jgi:hypothetical protein
MPLTELNIIGADNITITGLNFPRDLSLSTVSIKFKDPAATTCVPVKSSSTSLVCLTDSFDLSNSGNVYGMTIVINGQTVSNSLSFTLKTAIKSGITITPPSASPVLKSKLVINLENDFPFTLDRDSFTVNATKQGNSSVIAYMNVIAVDDSAKTLTVMFGGAYSGVYDVSIRHSRFGLLKTTGLTLTVGSTVTSVSPKVASIYGGTVITIQGTNFGYEATDNPVQISYNGGVDSTDCFVLTSSPTKITCRIDPSIT